MILQLQKVQVYQTEIPKKPSQILASKIFQNTDSTVKFILRHWRRSSVFVVAFEEDFRNCFVVFIVFEYVNTGWGKIPEQDLNKFYSIFHHCCHFWLRMSSISKNVQLLVMTETVANNMSKVNDNSSRLTRWMYSKLALNATGQSPLKLILNNLHIKLF